MRPSLKLGALVVVVGLVLGAAALATVARTFRVQGAVEFAYAIWNDEQLVVFVVRTVEGASPTVLEQLGLSVRGTPAIYSKRWAVISTVVRFQNGVVRSTTHHAGDRDPANVPFPNPLPRFLNGRPLVVSGFWNGNEIERVETTEYMRLLHLPESEDVAGRWHAGSLLRSVGVFELPVHVRGEVVRVKTSRTDTDASIELLRAGAPAVRLFDVRLAPSVVSSAEYESIFGGTRSVTIPATR